MNDLAAKLAQLKLAFLSRQLQTLLADAASKNLSLAASLEWLADLELEQRRQHAIQRRFHLSRLQTQPTIEQFHFQHHKSRMQVKTRLLRLFDLDFIAQGTNVILIGNPGTGKTFLAKILGWRGCQANYRVLFTTAMDMLNHLLASQADHSLVRKLKLYTEPAFLIVDELGYLSLDQQTSNLFYQVISTRHSQRRSTLITTNTAFSDWGNILFNTTIATAIADRLVENSEIFLLAGDSLRKAKKSQSLAGSAQAPPCDDNPEPRRSPAG
jgi:DNA replication protein DnaC